MSRRPRWLKGDASYCEVQRTVDRQFFFKPDEEIRQIIGSAAARAQKRYPVKLYWVDCNINHKQTGKAPLSDSPEHLENFVRFDQMFNSLVARGINKALDREGALFSTRNRSQEAIDDQSLEQQLFYAVLNPVKDGLVDRIAHWKGFSSYEQLATGKVERFQYIDWTAWHREGGIASGKAPEAFIKYAELKLSPIPAWEGIPDHKRQAMFRRRVRHIEQELRKQREREGRTVYGSTKLAKLDHRQRPQRPPQYKGPQPLCHASSREAAEEYQESWLAFLDQYYYASGMWLRGFTQVEFPHGSFKPPPLRVAA